MSPALNYKALLYTTPTHIPSICPFTRPHMLISALSMHLPPVLWVWIRAPATHFLGARILTTLPLSIPHAAFSALPQHLPSPFSVIVLSSQYGPIWVDSQHLLIHLHVFDVCELLKVSSADSFEKVCWNLSCRINKTTDVNLTNALRNVLDT